jgi:hypothetical protein
MEVGGDEMVGHVEEVEEVEAETGEDLALVRDLLGRITS